jgi:hypothetical protein
MDMNIAITHFFVINIKLLHFSKIKKKETASAGNRTRAARVAGEHSTTEPPMLVKNEGF